MTSDPENPGAAPEDHVLLGRLGKTFGLQGGLRFRALGDVEAEALVALDEAFVEGHGPMRIREVRRHGPGLVVLFDSVRRVERARQLVNSRVFAPAEALPAAGEGEFYIDELEGLPVSLDGVPLGEVLAVEGASGAELLRVLLPAGGEVLIPLHAPYVEFAEEEVRVVDPPPGLIEPSGP